MWHPQAPSEHCAPRIIAAGGLDPSCGAGIGRDLLSAAALDAEIVLVGTAWTVQSRTGVSAVEPRDPGAVRGALRAAIAGASGHPTAVKIGMVANGAIARALAEGLEDFEGPVVFDPVLAASSGPSLYHGETSELLPLLLRATLVTPNLQEGAHLLRCLERCPPPFANASEVPDTSLRDPPPARAQGGGEADRLLARISGDPDAAVGTALRLLTGLGLRAVLLKGGHMNGDPVDVLVKSEPAALSGGSPSTSAPILLSSPRIPGPSPRGTGCALATAIAVQLAAGLALDSAVREARRWLLARIGNAKPRHDETHLG